MSAQSRAPVVAPESSVATDTATGTGMPREHTPGTPTFDAADPLVSFTTIVDSGDGEDVLNACAAVMRQSPNTVNTIGADHTLMEKVATKLGRDRCPMGMLYLRQPLKWQVHWCGKAGGLTESGWGALVANATAQDCAEAVGWQAVCDQISALGGDPLVLMPPLSADPPKIKFCIDNYAWFPTWILDSGGQHRMVQITEAINRAEAAAMIHRVMASLGMWGAYLGTLGSGPSTDPELSQRLWYFALNVTDAAEGIQLFKARFGIDLTTINAATWDMDSIRRTWLIADRTPPADLVATLTVQREGTTGEAGGWAGDGTGAIGMTWGTNQLGATEVGAYTTDDDAMRGLNIFDSTLRHEIGHNVGLAQGFDQPAGFCYTQFGWQKHASAAGLLQVLNTFLGAHPLPLDFVPAGQQDTVRTGILTAISNTHANYNAAGFTAAVNTYGNSLATPIANLWTQIAGSDFITYLLQRTAIGAWDTQSDIGGRSYHVSYAFEGFVSAPSARYANKVSNYALRSPEEWFAEVYATFYADADRPGQEPGTLLAGRDAAAAAAMRTNVHDRHGLAQMTNQTNTVGVAAPRVLGDFPAPNLPPDTAYA